MTGMGGMSAIFLSYFFTIAKIKKPFAAARRFLILGFIYLTRVFYSYFRFYTAFLKVKIFFVIFSYTFSPIYILIFLLFCICICLPLSFTAFVSNITIFLKVYLSQSLYIKKKLVRLREKLSLFARTFVSVCVRYLNKKTNFPIRNPRIARS